MACFTAACGGGLPGRANIEWKYEDPDLHSAFGLLTAAVQLPWLFTMTQLPWTKRHIWPMLDQFAAIFVAVSWFQAFDEAVDTFFQHPSVLSAMLFNFGNMILMYLFAILLLWQLIKREYRLMFLSFDSCFAHVVSFSWMKAGISLQEQLFQSSPAASAGCCPLIFGVMALIGVAKRNMLNSLVRSWALSAAEEKGEEMFEEWKEASDDVRWDAAGMTLSVLITQAAHHYLVGDFDLLEDPEVLPHSAEHVAWFVVYAAFLTTLAAFVGPKLAEAAKITHDVLKFSLNHVIQQALLMTVAWSYFLPLRWLIFERLHVNFGLSSSFAQLVLASTISALAMAIILLATTVQWENPYVWRGKKRVKPLIALLLRSMSLITAWAWEECFDESIDALAQVGTSRVLLKVLLAVFISVFTVPLYVNFIKPKAAVYEVAE